MARMHDLTPEIRAGLGIRKEGMPSDHFLIYSETFGWMLRVKAPPRAEGEPWPPHNEDMTGVRIDCDDLDDVSWSVAPAKGERPLARLEAAAEARVVVNKLALAQNNAHRTKEIHALLDLLPYVGTVSTMRKLLGVLTEHHVAYKRLMALAVMGPLPEDKELFEKMPPSQKAALRMWARKPGP